ncbi:MAG: hypothetical protein IMZ52_04775 [Actinobacteria bacterium]|nr:hypothetical protein [Actinomycetota bacterium]MBE3114780.1 hypothetical protein [Actinomycetota bacterium]
MRIEVNNNFFDEWSPEMAYVLGYWFADGDISRMYKESKNPYKRFKLTSIDNEHLNKIKLLMKSKHKLWKDKTDCYALAFCSSKIYDRIVELGGCERKSLVAKFPFVPDEFVRHFIRGYFDGDGSVYFGGSKVPFASFLGTKDFLTILSNYLCYNVDIEKMGNIYRMTYSGEYAVKVLDYMYRDSKLFLSRKFDRYLKCMKWKRKRGPYRSWKQYILNNERLPICV